MKGFESFLVVFGWFWGVWVSELRVSEGILGLFLGFFGGLRGFGGFFDFCGGGLKHFGGSCDRV